MISNPGHDTGYKSFLAIFLLSAAGSWYMAFSHWFMNLMEPDFFFLCLGIVLYCFFAPASLYMLNGIRRYPSFLRGFIVFCYRKSKWMVFILIAGGLLALSLAASLTRAWHLHFYGRETWGYIQDVKNGGFLPLTPRTGSSWYMSYTVEGHLIRKSVPFMKIPYVKGGDQLRIRYSSRWPEIYEFVE